jgi:hypothetical protein
MRRAEASEDWLEIADARCLELWEGKRRKRRTEDERGRRKTR